jgi:phage shock protein E
MRRDCEIQLVRGRTIDAHVMNNSLDIFHFWRFALRTLSQVLFTGCLAVLSIFASGALAAESITSQQAYNEVMSNTAILVDVREDAEIQETGMAEPAIWLATTVIDSRGPAYQDAIATWSKDKTVIFYCRSGRRSGLAADHFAGLGFKTLNAGTFTAWKDAGLPIKQHH